MSIVNKMIVAGLLTLSVPALAQQQPFYAAPANLPSQAGTLLRAEPIKPRWIPKDAVAYRILYTTTGLDGRIGVASGVVLAPSTAAGGSSRVSDVIAWAHGTTGIDEGSAPSLAKDGLESGAMFVSQAVIDAGWTLVATDYVGLGTKGPHQYLVGVPAARAVLDATRAAHAMKGIALSDRTVVWGHSQGGGVALWTGVIAPQYAPDVHLEGVAALAPASDPAAILSYAEKALGGPILSAYAITGYSNTYPDVTIADYVRPDSVNRVREMSGRGLTAGGNIAAALGDKIRHRSIWRQDPATGPFGRRLMQNVPDQRIGAPLLIAQGTKDQLVPLESNQRYFARRKQDGTNVVYHEYAADHVGLVKPNSPLMPELFRWTAERFGADDRP